jgi:hypothetical protein
MSDKLIPPPPPGSMSKTNDTLEAKKKLLKSLLVSPKDHHEDLLGEFSNDLDRASKDNDLPYYLDDIRSDINKMSPEDFVRSYGAERDLDLRPNDYNMFKEIYGQQFNRDDFDDVYNNQKTNVMKDYKDTWQNNAPIQKELQEYRDSKKRTSKKLEQEIANKLKFTDANSLRHPDEIAAQLLKSGADYDPSTKKWSYKGKLLSIPVLGSLIGLGSAVSSGDASAAIPILNEAESLGDATLPRDSQSVQDLEQELLMKNAPYNRPTRFNELRKKLGR